MFRNTLFRQHHTLLRCVLQQDQGPFVAPVVRSIPRSSIGAIRQPHWQLYLHKRYDRTTRTWKYADWDDIARGIEEPMKRGMWEVERRLREPRHIKPNMRKYQNGLARVYNRKVKKVEDLLKHIQFMKEHPADFPATKKKGQ